MSHGGNGFSSARASTRCWSLPGMRRVVPAPPPGFDRFRSLSYLSPPSRARGRWDVGEIVPDSPMSHGRSHELTRQVDEGLGGGSLKSTPHRGRSRVPSRPGLRPGRNAAVPRDPPRLPDPPSPRAPGTAGCFGAACPVHGGCDGGGPAASLAVAGSPGAILTRAGRRSRTRTWQGPAHTGSREWTRLRVPAPGRSRGSGAVGVGRGPALDPAGGAHDGDDDERVDDGVFPVATHDPPWFSMRGQRRRGPSRRPAPGSGRESVSGAAPIAVTRRFETVR